MGNTVIIKFEKKSLELRVLDVIKKLTRHTVQAGRQGQLLT